MLNLTKNLGMLVLAIWLILTGLSQFVPLGGLGVVLAILAIIAILVIVALRLMQPAISNTLNTYAENGLL